MLGKIDLVLVELILRELLFVAVSRLIFIVTVSLGRRYISWARWSMPLVPWPKPVPDTHT